MTLTARNTILIVFLLIVTLFFLFFLAFILFLGFGFSKSVMGSDLYGVTETTASIGEIIATFGVYFVFALAAGFIMKSYFRKTTSPEIFFFILYVLSLSFRGLACFQIFLLLTTRPAFYGVLLTRLYIFGEIFGAGCLLTSGLFPTGIKTNKYSLFLGIIVLIGIILATSIPVDSSSLKPNLLYSIGTRKELSAVLFILQFLAIINYFIAGFYKNAREYYLVGAAVFLTVLGSQIIGMYNYRILTAVGIVFLAAGTILFSNRIHSMYMWR